MNTFLQLSTLIPPHLQLPYTTPTLLVRHLHHLESTTPHGVYTLIHGVSPQDLDLIDIALRENALRRRTRFTYEESIQSLIIRFMPSIGHEVVSREFAFEIKQRVVGAHRGGYADRGVYNCGGGRFGVPGVRGVRSKEGDEALRPATRGRDGWPSVVVEVGSPSHAPNLRLDASWWLENSSGSTKMVIILCAGSDPDSLHIETWEMVLLANTHGHDTRHRPAPAPTVTSPGPTQTITIDKDGVLTPRNTGLVIPYDILFDVDADAPPHDGGGTGRDIVFTSEELKEFAVGMFDAY
ncbi:hypothetical protein DFH27DRAFT_551451 [Peziza echinospora]|nr:hypothetical protein DFH27DRAFT_551451 [Peziza echinospora]